MKVHSIRSITDRRYSTGANRTLRQQSADIIRRLPTRSFKIKLR